MRERAEASANGVRRSRRHLAAAKRDSGGGREGHAAGDEAERAR
jgi:hypothetical protein